MGNSLLIPNCEATIRTKDGKKFLISYHSLVEHILLLRKVINHPEMTQEGPELNSYIQYYCQRMAQDEMRTEEQQLKLSWQIEWIWHVHRLHPLAYLNDCQKQLSNGIVDKKVEHLITKSNKKKKIKMVVSSMDNGPSLIPSIDLSNAVIKQKDFLEKFQKHFLCSYQVTQLDAQSFQNLIQNYVSFLKLATTDQLIVPTFEIDFIWHTHMRYPSHYHEVSKALCGFIVDHDDSIESNVLTDAYKKTADRWKQIYHIEYGQNIDRKHLEKSDNRSSCAAVFLPITTDPAYNTIYGESECGSINTMSDSLEYTGFTGDDAWDMGGTDVGDTSGNAGTCGGSGSE